MKRLLPTIILVLSFTLPVIGQQHPNEAKGFATDKPSDSFGPDSVNSFNGTLTISIPIGQQYTVSSALSYGFNLVYNSHPWDVVNNGSYVQVIPGRSSNAGLGWMLNLGDLILANDPRATSAQMVYESPDGAQHVFYNTVHDGETSYGGVQYTRDGTYLRIKGIYVTGQSDPISYEVEFPMAIFTVLTRLLAN